MIPESYKRFAQGGAFSGQQAEAPYRSSVSRGAPEPGYPNGRPRVDYGVGAPSVALSNEMEQRRQAAVARQTAKREGLATGRKDRALARNNGGFTPTSTANAKPGVERGGPGSAAPQAGPTGPVPGGNNEADHGIKQAALDQTLTHPIFSNEEAQGSFDGKKASVSQSLDFYGKHSGKWSEADKAEFKNYLDSRYGMDKSDSNQFRKDMDNILSDAPSNPGGPMTQENIDRVNAIRKMYGKPPVKTLVVSPDLGSHVVPGQPPRGNTGVGIY